MREQHELLKLRHRAGLTQVGLARRARVGVRTIQHIEDRTHIPHFYTRCKLLKALRIDFSQHMQIFDPNRVGFKKGTRC